MTDQSIDLKCPLCGKLLRAPRNMIEKKARCPKCKFQFVVKDPDEEDPQVILEDEETDQ